MADAANGATEDVLAKEEEAFTENVDTVKESVEEPVTVLVADGLAPEVEEKEVAVGSEVVTVEVASETVPLPAEDGKDVAVLDPVASETAYGAKETEEASLSAMPEIPSVAMGQEEIPESTRNPVPISASARSPTSWRSCCGLFDVLGRT
ncbi:hypothetical protein MLD38_003138 [Melastoma candidum]|uniref:Uncharacterized protein n=1 Tax=Melastoma candidum TaxID=119954 RepID=A0ACB9S1V8_9MYRT|nr:hypothetical protein MLD38_003138 [Melastoma candidum]